jgi:hypothetical protein
VFRASIINITNLFTISRYDRRLEQRQEKWSGPAVSAFGKKPGVSNGRPSFGVARPMTGGGGSAPQSQPSAIPEMPMPAGGEQFPPLDSVELPGTASGRNVAAFGPGE